MTTEEYKKYNPRRSTPRPDHIMLSICGDARHTMCVSWRTSRDAEDGYILYARADGGSFVRLDAFSKEIETDLGVNRMHYTKPEGLVPGTKYRYTVGNDEYRSGEFFFETEAENCEEFSFLVFTDQQRESPYELPDYSVERDLLTDALRRHPGIKFVFTGGDNSNNGENEIQWNGVFSGLEGFCESIPLMMITGNHDSRGYGDYFGDDVKKFWPEKARLFDAQFADAYPKNGPDGYNGEIYSFDYGNCHFAALSVNGQKEAAEWLYEDLKKSDKRWKIGGYHFPVYPVMPEGENSDGYPYLRKGIEEGKLDILFEGHEHSLARTYPMTESGMFDRPSQGVIHYIAGNGGRNPFTTNCRKIWHPKFYPQEENIYSYVVCEVRGGRMTLTAYLEDGRIADYLVVDKDADEIFPPDPAPVFRRPKMSFKGVIPELAARHLYVEEKDGVKYCAFAALVMANGGRVIKEPGKVSLKFYGTEAVFTEGAGTAEANGETVGLLHKVYRGLKNQLYISVPDIENVFGLHSQYYEYNRLLNFDCDKEAVTYEEN